MSSYRILSSDFHDARTLSHPRTERTAIAAYRREANRHAAEGCVCGSPTLVRSDGAIWIDHALAWQMTDDKWVRPDCLVDIL